MDWQICMLVTALFVNNVICQNPTCTIAANPKHTLCKYTGARASCLRRQAEIPTLAVQAFIVSTHNDYRKRVRTGNEFRGSPGPQPAATTGMGDLSWNGDLAAIAQRWADQCTFARDEFRNYPLTTGGTPAVIGQNAYGYLEFESTVRFPFDDNVKRAYWQEAIDYWYNEVRNFDSGTITSFVNNRPTNKYTQMIWGTVTQIGCGFTQWTYPNSRVARILVCNYGPGGNEPGQLVYTAAAPAG